MTKYMTKTELDTRRQYILMKASTELHQRYLEEGGTRAEQGLSLIKRCCRRIGAEAELPYVAIAYYILFNEDHFQSHNTVPIYLTSFMARLAALEGLDGWESVRVLRQDGEMVETNQVDDYIYRGEGLDNMGLYFFFAHFDLKTKASSQLRADTLNKKSYCRRIDLLPSHPLHDTTWLVEREEPVVPSLTGRSIPNRNNQSPEVIERYSKTILLLFKPWRTLRDLKTDEDWAGSFRSYVPDAASKQVIDNLQLLHSMKQQADEERRRGAHIPRGREEERLARDDMQDIPEMNDEARLNVVADDSANQEDPWALEALRKLEIAQLFNQGTHARPRVSVEQAHHVGTGEVVQQNKLWLRELRDRDEEIAHVQPEPPPDILTRRPHVSDAQVTIYHGARR
jgi:hypothetical protein